MRAQHFALNGSVDILTAPEISRRLDAVIRECDGELVIDCAGVDFIDSSGIGVLVRAREDLASSAALRITNLPSTGRRAIEAVGLIEYLGLDANTTQ